MRVRSLGREDPLEKGMATHSRIPAWETPWTGELPTVHEVERGSGTTRQPSSSGALGPPETLSLLTASPQSRVQSQALYSNAVLPLDYLTHLESILEY